MKSLIRVAALFIAALFFLPLCHMRAQDMPPQQGPGMGNFEEHSVRGDITAITGDTITVKTEEGDIYAVSTGPNTRLRKQRDPIKITDLHVGDMVAAIGDKDVKAKTLGAVIVVVLDKEQYEKARADFGKTWTAGIVQSIDGTNILIKRPDNVTQTIAVDENTSFRSHREDITLADIKAGDHVTARGALANGAFLATSVNLGGPGGFGSGAGGEMHHDTPVTSPPATH